jgi:hypothetical protein
MATLRIYYKPSFQTPAWIVHWDEIKDLDGVKDREAIAAILGIALEDEEADISQEGEDAPNRQVWFCEACHQVGCVEGEAHADVYKAMVILREAHQRVSPTCPIPVTLLRVINTAVIASRDTLIADPSIPAWVREPASLFLWGDQRGE